MPKYDPSSEDNEPAEPEQDEGEDTFLIPKSALYGKNIKPGDRETIEIVSIMDDEVEAKCVGKANNDKDEDSSSSPDMDRANSDLDALASPAEA